MGSFWGLLVLPPQNLCWVNFSVIFPEISTSGVFITVATTTGKPTFLIQEFIREPTSIPEDLLINFHKSSVSATKQTTNFNYSLVKVQSQYSEYSEVIKRSASKYVKNEKSAPKMIFFTGERFG